MTTLMHVDRKYSRGSEVDSIQVSIDNFSSSSKRLALVDNLTFNRRLADISEWSDKGGRRLTIFGIRHYGLI